MGEVEVVTVSAIAFFGIAAGGFVLCVIKRLQRVRSWESEPYLNTHPPIDDDEYLRLCGAGTNPKVALRVRAMVSDWARIDYECVYPDLHFRHDFLLSIADLFTLAP